MLLFWLHYVGHSLLFVTLFQYMNILLTSITLFICFDYLHHIQLADAFIQSDLRVRKACRGNVGFTILPKDTLKCELGLEPATFQLKENHSTS